VVPPPPKAGVVVSASASALVLGISTAREKRILLGRNWNYSVLKDDEVEYLSMDVENVLMHR
jgi:hypothetical protein